MSVFRRRGFDAHKEESERREKEKKNRQGKLWRFFLTDEDEEDVPIRFLTEEPILFYEHSIKTGGKWTNIPCTGDDCEECESGDRPSYKGAWLVVDGREVEIEDKNSKKKGKTKIIKDQIRLYVRGSTDIAKLDRLSKKFGLTTRPWFVTKTGEGTSTSYDLDRGEESELTVKEIKNLLSKIHDEAMRDHYQGDEQELYDIVEANIFDDVDLGGGADDEDEESSRKKKKKSSKKVSKKSRYEDDEDDEDEDEDDYEEEDEDEDDDDDDLDSGVRRTKSKSLPRKTSKPLAKKTIAGKKKTSGTGKKKSVFKR